MSKYDTADLVARCQRVALRPTTDAQQTTADWYAFLSEAQDEWYHTFATICPQVLYGNPTVMTTADLGLTYTFGTDPDGNNIFPMGSVEIRANPGGPLLLPTVEWGVMNDYVQEGDHIRWANNTKRQFGTTGPVARFITPPYLIDATHAPVLKPVDARMLLVYRACAKWARRGGLRDPQPFLDQEQEAWLGNPDAGVNGILGMLKTQFAFSGMEGIQAQDQDVAWWRSINTGSGYGG